MATYDNFSNDFKLAIFVSVAASLVSIISSKLIKDPLGFKNETNERIKSFLYTSTSSAILFPLFFNNWKHLFDDNDNQDNE